MVFAMAVVDIHSPKPSWLPRDRATHVTAAPVSRWFMLESTRAPTSSRGRAATRRAERSSRWSRSPMGSRPRSASTRSSARTRWLQNTAPPTSRPAAATVTGTFRSAARSSLSRMKVAPMSTMETSPSTRSTTTLMSASGLRSGWRRTTATARATSPPLKPGSTRLKNSPA